MVWSLCQAKFALPALIALAAIFVYYALNLFQEFEPIVSDTLPNQETELYFIMVPPAYSGDLEAQLEPLDRLMEYYENSKTFQEATLAAAETFVTNETISVASPIECSIQLYKVDTPPDPEDMWTARGVLVQMANFSETQRLAMELQSGGLDVPIQAVRFGPGPFVIGNHSIVEESYIFGLFTVYWVESLIDLHWEYFGDQAKYVVLRLIVMAQNYRGEITQREHVIMKSDSLDTYEATHPNHR